MNINEAKEIVKRMVADARKSAPPIDHPGHYPYIFGSLEAKVEWLLTVSDLKVKDFDEKGDLKIF